MTTDLGAQYREAKAALREHRQRWADAEQARADWLHRHRGVPSNLLYDRATGDPIDEELVELEAAIDRAEADDLWVRALIVACGEEVKGRSFDEVLASQGPRPSISEVVARVEAP